MSKWLMRSAPELEHAIHFKLTDVPHCQDQQQNGAKDEHDTQYHLHHKAFCPRDARDQHMYESPIFGEDNRKLPFWELVTRMVPGTIFVYLCCGGLLDGILSRCLCALMFGSFSGQAFDRTAIPLSYAFISLLIYPCPGFPLPSAAFNRGRGGHVPVWAL